MSVGDLKFSPLGYAAQANPAATSAHPSYTYIIDEMRSFLVSRKGGSEEERIQWTETLNRAVLGYPDAKRVCLGIIQDELMKRRWLDTVWSNRLYQSLEEAVYAEVVGMSVLELLLQDRAGLEEIQVVGTQVYEVRAGQTRLTPFRFEDIRALERVQQNLVLFNQDSLHQRKRWAEVRLRDGSRVTMTGFGYTSEPTLTIRFYTVAHFGLERLASAELDTISEPVRRMLLCILESRLNVVIIGPTNSGKTNLLKSLIAEIPDEERIVTIEARLELMLRRDFPAKNVVEFEVDEEDPTHNGRQAFKLALRQTPKRIIHAEIRDEDANLYVRACTRGHEGSMSTVHVTCLEDAPEAITDMCMLDGRGMNSDRLTKRITEHVTQIGIEMRISAGKRRLVRLGEYQFREGAVQVIDWAVFNPAEEAWDYPQAPSPSVRQRMLRLCPSEYTEVWGSGH
ncbi:ATPase, T2SS/T4P/T4SS family [Paenibacillus turpanensis]|uniref:ATPase, T2SS/T4P/T4SS family n=1 Tax=Paenibacillus turpanensis TaxID=2689078 RepID=UPI0014087EBC|nr:ATPase, T2SS/T4P/T4SS family [Paenibacillus turpanensis]